MPELLRLDRLTKRFGALKAVDDLTLALDEGEALGVIGPNGAGKTTMFNLITGDLRPDTGQVIFAGADISAAPPEQRCRAGIGRSYQIPHPFGGMTVFENALVGATSAPGAAKAKRRRSASTFLSVPALRATPTRWPAPCRCSTASGWNWPARWRRGLRCCCSTKSPAG